MFSFQFEGTWGKFVLFSLLFIDLFIYFNRPPTLQMSDQQFTPGTAPREERKASLAHWRGLKSSRLIGTRAH